MISFMICTAYLTKKNEAVGAFGTLGEERCLQVFDENI
jgi:hypothetical protein